MCIGMTCLVESARRFLAARGSFRQTGDFARHDLILSHLINHLTFLLSLSLTSYNSNQHISANMTGRAAGEYNCSDSSDTAHDMLEAAALDVIDGNVAATFRHTSPSLN